MLSGCKSIRRCKVIGGVLFNDISAGYKTLPKKINYTIRVESAGEVIQTTSMFPERLSIAPRKAPPDYVDSGFLFLQHRVNIAIIRTIKPGAPINDTRVRLKWFPRPPYTHDEWTKSMKGNIGFYVWLMFLFYIFDIASDMVGEKHAGMEESMRMAGVSSDTLWVSSFVVYGLQILITISIFILILCVPLSIPGRNHENYPFKRRAAGFIDSRLLFVFLAAYAMSTITFSFALSVCFHNEILVRFACVVISVVTYAIGKHLVELHKMLPWGAKMAGCLNFNAAMPFGVLIMELYQGKGDGVQWSTVNQPVIVDDDFTFLHAILMLFTDAIVYAIFAWYIGLVWPGKNVTPLPWNFPLRCFAWRTHHKASVAHDDESKNPSQKMHVENIYGNACKNYACLKNISLRKWPGVRVRVAPADLYNQRELDLGRRDDTLFEDEPVGLYAYVQIKNVRKVFLEGSGSVAAVNDVTLNLYEGQITALVGQRGAGKTTIVNLLTGFHTPTSGSIVVDGMDIQTDRTVVRSNIGVCPQDDAFYDSLTVIEHIEFVAKLRGCTKAWMRKEMSVLLADSDLIHRKHTPVDKLGECLKRQLSVLLALVGRCNILALDEPTWGLDAPSRQEIWNVLEKHSRRKATLLVTQRMDEARRLADRIVVIVNGRLQCCGSPRFLQKCLGTRYRLHIKQEPTCEAECVTNFVQSYAAEASLEYRVNSELCYSLSVRHSAYFGKMLTEMDARKGELRVSDYSLTAPKMSSLGITHTEGQTFVEENLSRGHVDAVESASNLEDKEILPLSKTTDGDRSAVRIFLHQWYPMCMKRLLYIYYRPFVTLLLVLVPLGFSLTVLYVTGRDPGRNSPPLVLNLSPFGGSVVAYRSRGPVRNLASLYIDQLHDPQDTVVRVNGLPDRPPLEAFLLSQGERDLSGYTYKYFVAAEFLNRTDSSARTNVSTVDMMAFFNYKAYHTAAISLNLVDNALLRHYTGDDYTIETTNHPVWAPNARTYRIMQLLSDGDYLERSLAVAVVTGLALLMSSFVVAPIEERVCGAKQRQFSAGLQPSVFWGAMFLSDVVVYAMPCSAIVATLVTLDVSAFTNGSHLWHVAMLFTLYGWAMLTFIYCTSFYFSDSGSAFAWLTFYNVGTGLIAVNGVSLLRTVDMQESVNQLCMYTMPTFCLGRGLYLTYSNMAKRLICERDFDKTRCAAGEIHPCCKETCSSRSASSVCIEYDIGLNPDKTNESDVDTMLISLVAHGLLYTSIIACLDSRLMHRLLSRLALRLGPGSPRTPVNKTGRNVAREYTVIHGMTNTVKASEYVLVVEKLTKWNFGRRLNPSCAVNGVTFGVRAGQCFGLIGRTDAGKTTLFRMLTGEVTVTSGTALVAGHDVTSGAGNVCRHIGYCPQRDALLDFLTVRQTLRLYARIRGLSKESAFSRTLLQTLSMTDLVDTRVGCLGVSNRRKLNIVVAMLGYPPLLLLDDPTRGMDPVARKNTCDLLRRYRESGGTIVTTSTSISIYEDLCSHVAVMMNGRLTCLGTLQDLMAEFGRNFKLTINAGDPMNGTILDMVTLQEYVEETFPGSVLDDTHKRQVSYYIPRTDMTLAMLFERMEAAKALYNIEYYSVEATSLEDVFIRLTRKKQPPQRPGIAAKRT